MTDLAIAAVGLFASLAAWDGWRRWIALQYKRHGEDLTDFETRLADTNKIVVECVAFINQKKRESLAQVTKRKGVL